MYKNINEIEDPSLQEHTSVSSEGYEYTFIAIPENVIRVVSAFIQLVWTINKYQKSIKAKEVIQNAKSMFELNQRTVSDVLWKEHCASSLRELVDNHFSANCTCTLKCLPNSTNKEGEREKIYSYIQIYKTVLNKIAHLNTDGTLEKIKIIPGYENLEEISSEVFDKICTNYIMLLYELFKQCMKGR